MRMVCITDLHGAPQALDRILSDAGPADVVLLGGDITSFGTPNAAEFLVRRAMEHCPQVLAVAGNCDAIISGDRHLLEISGYEGIEVLTPRQLIVATDDVVLCDGSDRANLHTAIGAVMRGCDSYPTISTSS